MALPFLIHCTEPPGLITAHGILIRSPGLTIFVIGLGDARLAVICEDDDALEDDDRDDEEDALADRR